MIDNEYPALRAAVRDSIIGTAIASVTASTMRAVTASSASRIIQSQVAGFRGLTGAEAIKLSAIALTTACIAIWGLSLFVPLYVSTAIPRSAFLVFALIGAAAAVTVDSIADQWARSRMRRVTSWLRGA